MVKILIIIGTRPEAIKMAPVIKELQKFPEKIRCIVCITGQHRQMLDQVLDLFAIKPDYDLNIMQPSQSLSQLTARLLVKLEAVFKQTEPNWILAQGDTTTVLAASLMAFYNRIPFGHVEAGLRTGDKFSPFPEEINRRLADMMSDLFFAPTERAREALLSEGISGEKIYVTGNTIVDALMDVAGMEYDWESGPLSHFAHHERIVLITAHRRESFGIPFMELCSAIRELALLFENDDIQFVYPVHLNPNVRKPVQQVLSNLPNVHLIEPLEYRALVHLMKRATLILTDSGGIQEEAPTFGVPVLVMRNCTERQEGVEAGVAKLVGTQKDIIVKEAKRLLSDTEAHTAMSNKVNPYGDGLAARRIVSILMGRLNL